MADATTAVTVIEQSPDAIVEWNLDNWPIATFNRLVPTTVLGLATDLIRPIVQTVVLDIERDTYASNDLPKGHRAPNVHGLALLAAAAGVDFPDEARMDDGSDPLRASAKTWATMVDGTGRTRTVTGSRDYALASQPMTDAQRQRAKGYVYEHALTRARHRALRLLLGLPQSYSVADLAKPFAVVSYVPNMQHPELRAAVLKAMVPTVAALYGPAAAKQLSAGNEVIELPDDDDDPRNVTPAPSTPTVMPGETLAAAQSRPLSPGRAPRADADSGTQASAAPGASGTGTEPEEPAWMRGGAAQESKADAAPSLRDIVAERLADEGQPTGPVTAEQGARIGAIFAPCGEDRVRMVRRGIRALGLDTDNLTAAQARAIAMAHDELGTAPFLAEWTELAA